MRFSKSWLRGGSLAALAGAVALPLSAAMVFGPAAPAGASSLHVGTFANGIATEITDPTGMPAGSDTWSCKPSRTHPYPVVLVHGTLANENFSWQALSPELKNAGYCVYAFNYGADGSTITHFFGLAPIATSAKQLSTFVNRVLASTGASKVDLVGHSQGGMMPRYYIQDLGGAAKVNMLVALAPSNDGTTALGFSTLVSMLKSVGINFLTLAGCYSCTQQLVGSSFLSSLNAAPSYGESASVKYVVISTKYTEIVTPYTNNFLHPASNVQQIILQNQCPIDFSEHIGIIYDPVALQDVLNAFGADSTSFKPKCSLVLPVVGG
jgi:triacylglycerol esterase/lipase EstA (alpha/beta hydrolase family)